MSDTPIADLIEEMSAMSVDMKVIILAVRALEARPQNVHGLSADKLADRREKDRIRKRLARKLSADTSVEMSTDVKGGMGGSLPFSSLSKDSEGSKEVSKIVEMSAKCPQNVRGQNGQNGHQIGSIPWAIYTWNETAKARGLPQVKHQSPARKDAVTKLLRQHGMEGWAEALHKLTQSPGCLGDNEHGWKMDFDTFTKPAKFIKLLEGAYDHWKPKQSELSGAFDRLGDKIRNQQDSKNTTEGGRPPIERGDPLDPGI